VAFTGVTEARRGAAQANAVDITNSSRKEINRLICLYLDPILDPIGYPSL
jgi:hypothetical protein